MFGAIKDNIWKKLKGWKEKLLSRAGKEVLIKAVIQAIPTYLMSMFKLPAGLIDEINKLCAQFWWGSGDGKRKIHWKAWDSLCQPKGMGGMGFRKLDVFNDALLAKQGWRLVTNEGSLLAQVLKGKYYPNTDFLSSWLGYRPSYSWRGIWATKSLLHTGLGWQIGNGNSVGVWSDKWLLDSESLKPTTGAGPGLESLKVSDLIDFNSMSWRTDEISSIFNEEDKNHILAIPLSPRLPPDRRSWCFSDSGIYTVKSAYLLGASIDLNAFDTFWPALWSTKIVPKARHFWWQACSNTLPTKSLLYHRHISDTDVCARCGNTPEDFVHCVFLCQENRGLWQDHGQAINLATVAASRASPALIFADWQRELGQEELRWCLTAAWQVWFARNDFVFNNNQIPVAIVNQRTSRSVTEITTEAAPILPAGQNFTTTVWTPPPPNHVKLNTDASLKDEGWIGLGAVIRDPSGEVDTAAIRRVQARWSARVAEAKAVLYGLGQALRAHHRNIIVDCASLISSIRCPVPMISDFGSVIDDIRALCPSFDHIVWSHVKRCGNTVAHNLALFRPFSSEQIWIGVCPDQILPFVENDKLSLI